MEVSDLTVDDLVSTGVAEQLGPGRIPVRAILIVETMSEATAGLRFFLSENIALWHAAGMLASVHRQLEAEDLANWADDEDG